MTNAPHLVRGQAICTNTYFLETLKKGIFAVHRLRAIGGEAVTVDGVDAPSLPPWSLAHGCVDKRHANSYMEVSQ